MIFRYRITLVGSEEPGGSRLITCKSNVPHVGDLLFSVEPKYLKEYVPNAGDTLVRRHRDGRIWFEKK